MASGPITSCQIDVEKVETVSDFILGGSKIIAHVAWKAGRTRDREPFRVGTSAGGIWEG